MTLENALAQLQRELQQHVLCGDVAIEKHIGASAAIPAATRLKIYSDAYRLRLIEALEGNFPVLARTLGPQDFVTLAQCYLSSHPSRHFSIRWFGDRLSEYVAADDAYRDRLWLRELVAWEWATTLAFDAQDSPVLAIEDLATVAPEAWPALRFKIHPSLQRLSIGTNVVALVQASVENVSAPAPRALANRGEWCLWRDGLTVRYRSLDSAEATAIDALIAGGNFSDMCEALTAHIDADAVPMHAATLLKQWIDQQWLVQFD